jgi:hypothetical protein
LYSADTAFDEHLHTQTSSWRRNINVRQSGKIKETSLGRKRKYNLRALFVLVVNLFSFESFPEINFFAIITRIMIFYQCPSSAKDGFPQLRERDGHAFTLYGNTIFFGMSPR